MSGGILPRYTVTARQRSQVSVVAQGRPLVASVTVRGQQGIQGAPGPAGINTGFGYAVYTHALVGVGDLIPANTRTQLTFTPDPNLTTDRLNAPFAGHVFWDGSKVVGRALSDALFIQVNLQVTPAVEGGGILIDLDAGSTIGPITSDSETLGANATIMQRVSGKLYCQTATNFMANGGKIFLTTSVDARILRESIFIIPQSIYTGS